MRPPLYTRQLRKDLDDWIARGWIPEASRTPILKSVGALGPSTPLAGVLAILGVLLLAAGAVAFVAANWNDLGRLPKLILLFGGMSLTYALAGWAILRGWEVIGQAGILLGVALFGVSLMLIGQIYHLPQDWPSGFLLWSLGALAAAVIVPSRPALGAAAVLGGLWTFYAHEATGFDVFHWAFLPYAAIVVGAAAWMRWPGGLHLGFLALLFWVALSIGPTQALLGWTDVEMVTLYITGFLGLWVAGRLMESPAALFALSLQRYGLIVAGILLFILPDTGLTGMARMEAPPPVLATGWIAFALAGGGLLLAAGATGRWRGALSSLDLAALAGITVAVLALPAWLAGLGTTDTPLEVPYLVVTLLYLLWVIAHALRVEDRVLSNLGFLGFGVWVLYVYWEVFGSYMDAAAFFTIGGVILVVLAIALEAVRRRVAGPAGPSPHEETAR